MALRSQQPRSGNNGDTLPELEVLDRSGGPATSAVEGFRLPGLPELQLFAYGTTAGSVVVQQLKVSFQAYTAANIALGRSIFWHTRFAVI